MAKDVNVCQFIGRLGQDPEVRYLQSGNAVTNISLAVNDEWTDKQTGQKQEKVEWVRGKIFGNRAEALAKYTKKGSRLYISGRLETRSFEDQSGQTRYMTEVSISDFQFLDQAPSQAQSQAQPQGQPNPQPQPASQEPQQTGYPGGGHGAPGDPEQTDSIPF